MYEVLLRRDWTDANGVVHSTGEVVEVDYPTGKSLVDGGSAEWVGMTGQGA